MPLYNRVTIYQADDATVMTVVSTDPAHAKPWLIDESILFGESKINFAEGSAGIGQFVFKLLDKRTVAADQRTGWFTALLADGSGRGNILGHRVLWERQQIGGGGAYTVIFDGIVDDVQLDPDHVTYTIPCRDIRERERTARIFTKTHGTALAPNGPINGWGQLPGPVTPTYILPPVVPLHGGFWMDPSGAQAGRVRCDKNQYDLIITAARYQVMQQYGALIQGLGTPSNDTGLKFRHVCVWWRPEGSGAAYTKLSNMPQVLGTEWAMDNVFPLGNGWFQIAEDDSFLWFKHPKNRATLLVNMTGPGIPVNGQRVEIIVEAAGQPSDDVPYYWEGNLGQLTKDIYDGLESDYLPGIRYDAAAMADFIQKSVRGRAIITKPEDNGLQWLQENTYKVQGWVPSVPPDTGRVTPIQYNLPTVTEPLLVINDAMVRDDAKWELAKDETVNQVTFEWEAIFVTDSKYTSEFAAYYMNANQFDPPAQRIGRLPMYYQEVAVNSQALLGMKEIKYKPLTIKQVATVGPVGIDMGRWAGLGIGQKIAQDRSKELLDRFSLAGQRLTIFVRRQAAGVPAAKMGKWCQVSVSWLPDYVTQIRGLNRIMQIIAINDDDKVFRKFVLSDAGPNAQAVSASVLGAITQALGIISIPVTTVPVGGRVNVDYAVSVLEPAIDSGEWISLGRTDVVATLKLGPLTPGASVWIRSSGEAPGRRRSAFTASVNIVVTNAPTIISAQVTFDSDGHARVTWDASSTTLGVRIAYVLHDAAVDYPALASTLDVDASLGTVQLPVIPAYSQAISLKLTPYPGFAAGAVSGVAGATTAVITARNKALGGASNTLPLILTQTTDVGNIGTITLNIYDPELRITKIEFQTQQSNGAWSGWVQDSTVPYAASVTTAPGQASKIAYRVTGYGLDGILTTLSLGEVVFGQDAVVMPDYSETTSEDAAGTVGTLTIVPRSNIQGRISRVDFKAISGRGAVVNTSVNAPGPYVATVPLIPKVPSKIEWEAFGTDASGATGVALFRGAVPFNVGSRPGAPSIKVNVLASGVPQVGVVGDSDAVSAKALLVLGSVIPSQTDIVAGGTVGTGRTPVISLAAIKPGQEFTIAAVSINSSGVASDPVSLTKTWLGINTSPDAGITLNSVTVQAGKIVLNITVPDSTLDLELYMVEQSTAFTGAPRVDGIVDSPYKVFTVGLNNLQRNVAFNIDIPLMNNNDYVAYTLVPYDLLGQPGIVLNGTVQGPGGAPAQQPNAPTTAFVSKTSVQIVDRLTRVAGGALPTKWRRYLNGAFDGDVAMTGGLAVGGTQDLVRTGLTPSTTYTRTYSAIAAGEVESAAASTPLIDTTSNSGGVGGQLPSPTETLTWVDGEQAVHDLIGLNGAPVGTVFILETSLTAGTGPWAPYGTVEAGDTVVYHAQVPTGPTNMWFRATAHDNAALFSDSVPTVQLIVIPAGPGNQY